jgi:hypothetical protein
VDPIVKVGIKGNQELWLDLSSVLGMQEGGHVNQVNLFFGASELDGAPRLVSVRVENPGEFRKHWEALRQKSH